MTQRQPRITSNMLSLIGLFIAVFNIVIIVVLAIADGLSAGSHPYADLVIWIALPGMVFCGVALIFAGIWRQRYRERTCKPGGPRFPVLDFNDPRLRTRGLVLLSVLILMSLLYAFSGYKAYEFSESNTFCGTCHAVMGPETRSNYYSAHAKLLCTNCHVGPGAKYYFTSHLKGSRQGINYLLDRYSRPIHTPVADLRPSEEICQNCHGPKYQISERLESRAYFLSDKENSRKKITLLFKPGTAQTTLEQPPHMHWHSSTTEEILYSDADPKRVDIPWIRVKRRDGSVRVYRSDQSKLSAEKVAQAGTRRMDCMDCHNRIGHPFNPPARIVNAMLSAGLIDSELPEIKHVGVQALETPYASQDEARMGIDTALRDFYRATYPAVAKDKDVAIAKAVEALQGAYARNYDPHMDLSWRSYGSNQGHVYAPGCFRCHDGKHRSEDGTVLSRDCSLCHLLIERSPGQEATEAAQVNLRVMEYPHPVDIGERWKTMPCTACHGASS